MSEDVLKKEEKKETGDYARPTPIIWKWGFETTFFPDNAISHNRICVAIHDPALCQKLQDKVKKMIDEEMLLYMEDPSKYSVWLRGTME